MIKLFISILLIFPLIVHAQEHSHAEEDEAHKKFRIGISSVNSHVPAGKTISDREVIPAWGLEFEYKFAKRWSVGLLSEVELQSYLVEHNGEEELEREYPYTALIAVTYDLRERVLITVGGGVELEKNENFEMITFGAAYMIPLLNDWDFTPGVAYNQRIDAFDSWSLNLTFGKSF